MYSTDVSWRYGLEIYQTWLLSTFPGHGDTLVYKCVAGGKHNRLTSNYDLDSYNLTCHPDNQFSIPTWPTCAASRTLFLPRWLFLTTISPARYCPDPKNYVNEFITTNDTSNTDLEFLSKVWWVGHFFLWESAIVHLYAGGSVRIKGLTWEGSAPMIYQSHR